MASHDMDDDDIYPENDNYEPQETRMQDVDDEEEGEEVESDSEVRRRDVCLDCDADYRRTISTSLQM